MYHAYPRAIFRQKAFDSDVCLGFINDVASFSQNQLDNFFDSRTARQGADRAQNCELEVAKLVFTCSLISCVGQSLEKPKS